MEEMLFRTVADFGVPTVVCFFLLFKGTKSMDALTASINELIRSNARVEQSLARLESVIINHYDRK